LVNNQFIKIYGVWLHLCHSYSLGHSAEGFGVEQNFNLDSIYRKIAYMAFQTCLIVL